MTTTLRLPRKHAADWFDRVGEPEEWATLVGETARTVTLELTPEGLADLTADAAYYAEAMGPADTGDVDYRPAARTCLAHLRRLVLVGAR
jgi:hypothetical protein